LVDQAPEQLTSRSTRRENGRDVRAEAVGDACYVDPAPARIPLNVPAAQLAVKHDVINGR
jgi:hypothetical protein